MCNWFDNFTRIVKNSATSEACLFLMCVEQYGEVEAATAAVDARGKRGDMRLQFASNPQNLLGVALARPRQFLCRREQLLGIRVRVLGLH